MVRAAPVTTKMYEYMADKNDKNWQMHFEKLTVDAGFPELVRLENGHFGLSIVLWSYIAMFSSALQNDFDPVVPKIREACLKLSQAAPSFQRKTLQTRFFETGDNYYLGTLKSEDSIVEYNKALTFRLFVRHGIHA